MHCIFCKVDSSLSQSVEHIVPHSLGNNILTLPKGAVCDSCNNYFAIHIEKPILESEEFTYLRFNQEVRNKKRKIPQAKIIFGNQVVNARRNEGLDFSFDTKDFDKIRNYLNGTSQGVIYIPVSGSPPDPALMGRWLAKMGLELLAHKWKSSHGWNEYIVEHDGLDAIRSYARYPKPKEAWSFSARRIYDANSAATRSDGLSTQVIYECDILATGTADSSEFYFIVAFFGMEYAINLGGDSMDGYYKWLENHNQQSPLYSGNNSSSL